ncbi:similar to Saccharomyces cerevisiae YOR111W Putative protein of unknown function [Maudiozyma saulgeensis]|uniref:Maf-like protein n=1 Tax=Maudiozyma saulgeensis TaxID=1789683 RepID=A0A1X7QZS8_9SACH|nr:similar to Saccharomyces cerevisiae YOR111W Putative protein of unknown function [Kazachstania saulgeensis]
MQCVDKICSEYKVVLASSSPRRYEIMHDNMGFNDLLIMKPTFEEDLDKSLYINNPIQYVVDTSYGKAQSILVDLQNVKEKRLVVCADTIVLDWDNIIYEKPGTAERQLENLKRFCYESEKPLKVVTAVTIIEWDPNGVDHGDNDTNNKLANQQIRQFHEISNVYFDSKISEQVIQDYVNSEDGLQVAGGFKVQGYSGILINRIEGDYYNIVGLPLNRTFKELLSYV